MRELWRDFLRGFRLMAAHPGFSAAAVVALALGIGSTSALFSVVDAALLRPLDYQDPQRLVMVWERQIERGLPRMFASPPNFADWRSQSRSFEALGAYDPRDFFIGGDGRPQQVRGTQVTSQVLSLLKVEPRSGRLFTPEDDLAGADKVVLISHRLWQTRFASAAPAGLSLLVDEVPHQVVGVMPEGFDFPPPVALEGTASSEKSDLWVPFAINMAEGQRGAHFMTVLGRLKPEVSVQQAEQEMQTLAASLAERFPNSNQGWDVVLVPLHEQMVGGIQSELLLLLAAVGFLLLIACVNVANLLLARATARRREFAVRSALGAARGRLLGQLLAEGQALALSAAALGLLLAYLGLQGLVGLAPDNVPRLDEASLDWRAVAFTVSIGLFTGLLFGMAPALQSFTRELSKSLREGDRSGSEGRGALNARSLLVVLEVALSIVLLVGAGLLFRSFLSLLDVDRGFETTQVVTARVSLPSNRYPDADRRIAAFRDLEELINASGSFQSAGFTLDIPLGADRQGTSFYFEGEDRQQVRENRQVNFSFVTPRYFETMGIDVMRGRTFAPGDDRQSQDVIVINQALVERFFGNQDPLGQRLVVGFNSNLRRVVGVVGNVRHDSLRSQPSPTVYVPYYQVPWSGSLSLVARGPLSFQQTPSALRGLIDQYDSALPVYRLQSMGTVVSDSLGQERFAALLLAVFSGLALLLACVGLYGVISYSVSRRYRETGIRMVMGARPADIFRLVLKQGLILTVAGVGAGIVLSLGLTRWLSSLLYGVEATDWFTYGSVCLLLLTVAAAACLLPARRATRVDPMTALRAE
ncbi:MAG TPA: ABC transporter permease [Acidobacteriota bacterium]|nr:ABC transporter permease [Acidobacteriota bacterium]